MGPLGIGSRRLENAHRIALETEDVGADILRNLRGQREQIEHTRDTVSRMKPGLPSLNMATETTLLVAGTVDANGFGDRSG